MVSGMLLIRNIRSYCPTTVKNVNGYCRWGSTVQVPGGGGSGGIGSNNNNNNCNCNSNCKGMMSRKAKSRPTLAYQPQKTSSMMARKCLQEVGLGNLQKSTRLNPYFLYHSHTYFSTTVSTTTSNHSRLLHDSSQRQRRWTKQYHHHQQQHFSTDKRQDNKNNHLNHDYDDSDDETTMMIRLSKRMSQLDLCSRREADRYIQQGLVLVQGERAVLGQKINPNLIGEHEIRIIKSNYNIHHHPLRQQQQQQTFNTNIWEEEQQSSLEQQQQQQQQQPRRSSSIKDGNDNDDVLASIPSQNLTHQFVSIILNKPRGYVSGQAEHGNTPAVRLLTLDRLWKTRPTTRLPQPSSSSSTTSSDKLEDDTLSEHAHHQYSSNHWRERILQENNEENDWTYGLAPAGRLDRDSSGLLILTQSGVLAKKLVNHHNKVEKEYIVHVEPAQQVARRERLKQQELQNNDSPTRTSSSFSSSSASYYIRQEEIEEEVTKREKEVFQLPPPTQDLRILTKGGSYLQGERRPLKPCRAKWIVPGRILRIILKEGKKHQIRRSCRQLLGYHVIDLQRIRIGPIAIRNEYNTNGHRRGMTLPEGRWRPLTEDEIDDILRV